MLKFGAGLSLRNHVLEVVYVVSTTTVRSSLKRRPLCWVPDAALVGAWVVS